MATYFITGTSRGLGLEFVKQVLENESGSKVTATARRPQESSELVALHQEFPESLSLISMDIDNTESVKDAALKVSEIHPNGIDYLINNAGASGNQNSDSEEFLRIFNTNVVGSFRVYESFLPLIRKGHKKVVVQLTSTFGCIALQEQMHNFIKLIPGADFYAYRTSKAALNCMTAQLAATHRAEGIVFLAVHPGLVDTDMYRNYSSFIPPGSGIVAIPKASSVKGILEIAHKATIADSGKFIKWDGSELPW